MVKYINRNNILHMEKCAAYVTESITLAQCVCHQLLTRRNRLESRSHLNLNFKHYIHEEDKTNSERI